MDVAEPEFIQKLRSISSPDFNPSSRFTVVIRVVGSTLDLASLIHCRSSAGTFDSSSLIESSPWFFAGSRLKILGGQIDFDLTSIQSIS